jgi:hypothetical protein
LGSGKVAITKILLRRLRPVGVNGRSHLRLSRK